jgi:putative Holliday junction resolvase
MLTNYIALDVGRARIGVAAANSIARIAAPVPAVANDEQVLKSVQTLVNEYQASVVVVGWPRGLSGQETDQTRYVAEFVEQLKTVITVPIELQDEAATSLKAEAELKARGKVYEKGEIDSLSAVYILEDYLAEGVH